jgi:hypothetical protein
VRTHRLHSLFYTLNHRLFWQSKRRRQWRDPRRGLRSVERYVQDIVAQQPNPPREFRVWYVVRQQIRIRTIIAVLVILTFLIWMNYSRAIRGDYNSFDVRYWLGTAMLAAGLLWVVGS